MSRLSSRDDSGSQLTAFAFPSLDKAPRESMDLRLQLHSDSCSNLSLSEIAIATPTLPDSPLKCGFKLMEPQRSDEFLDLDCAFKFDTMFNDSIIILDDDDTISDDDQTTIDNTTMTVTTASFITTAPRCQSHRIAQSSTDLLSIYDRCRCHFRRFTQSDTQLLTHECAQRCTICYESRPVINIDVSTPDIKTSCDAYIDLSCSSLPRWEDSTNRCPKQLSVVAPSPAPSSFIDCDDQDSCDEQALRLMDFSILPPYPQEQEQEEECSDYGSLTLSTVSNSRNTSYVCSLTHRTMNENISVATGRKKFDFSSYNPNIQPISETVAEHLLDLIED